MIDDDDDDDDDVTLGKSRRGARDVAAGAPGGWGRASAGGTGWLRGNAVVV